MNTLITMPFVERSGIEGFEELLDYNALPVAGEKKLKRKVVVLEPTFLEFKDATSDVLGLPYTVPSLFDTETLIIIVSYSQSNAKVYKGYLLDLVKHWESHGYSHYQGVHLPYEGYGSPMVGSALLCIFTKKLTAFLPKKLAVYPDQLFPDLVRHSLTGKPLSGVAPGSGQLVGLALSSKTFLPPVINWGNGLPVECRTGQTVEFRVFGKDELNTIFGCSDYRKVQSFQYCTPKAVLKTLLDIKAPATHGKPVAA